MNIIVGGSYHEPGLSEVFKTAEKLRNAGHTVLYPKKDAKPINVADQFVRFEGEENSTPNNLEMDFLNLLESSDAFVVADLHGYIGQAAVCEISWATALISLIKKHQISSPFKKIFLTEPPAGYEAFKEYGPSHPSFKQELDKVADMYKQYYSSIEEYYDDTERLYARYIDCENQNILEIGIESLLNQKREIEDDLVR